MSNMKNLKVLTGSLRILMVQWLYVDNRNGKRGNVTDCNILPSKCEVIYDHVLNNDAINSL